MSNRITFFGIPIVEIYNCVKSDYKKQKIKILGIKFPYKSKAWIEKSNEQNNELNKKNLHLKLPSTENSILFIASSFHETGGVETRVCQYIQKLIAAGRNVYLLSEKNTNKHLLNLPNFYLNFDAENFNNCLLEIINKYNISIVEFQFKNSKILKNLNIEHLKTKAKIGAVIHNLNVSNTKLINKLDYKIFVSKYMYDNFYKCIKNPLIIQNSIDPNTKEYKSIWTYKNQKTALLISRLTQDKIKSIECFIKYCQNRDIDFKIAGEEEHSGDIKNKLTRKFNLSENTFIGRIDTIDYLSTHCNDILFVGGVGLVILEGLYLGYPCFCCSDFNGENYSFITESNISLFDNFTIRKRSAVSKLRKKELIFDFNDISKYYLRDYVIKYRDLSSNFRYYLNILNKEK